MLGTTGSHGVQFDLQSLLQDLLLALVGVTGDIFVDSSAQDPSRSEIACHDQCTISLAPDIRLADDVNREELNQLVQMGFHFQQVKHFIQQEQQPVDNQRSMYRCALCCGLDEVLCLCEDEVVLLQDHLLQHGLDRGLPGITYHLADLQRLLTHMHCLVYKLRRRSKLNLTPHGSTGGGSGGALDSVPPAAAELVVLPHTCGARLLHWLHDRKAHGEPLLQSCTQRLLWHVHQVMFNQLAMWMVHGVLIDRGSEFFVTHAADASEKASEGVQPAPAAGTAAGAAAVSDTDAVRDSSNGDKPEGGSGCLDVTLMTEDDTYEDFHWAFVVNNLQRPPGLSTHTASSVEFVGRAVRLLKSAPAAAKLREMQDSFGSYNQQQMQQGQGMVRSMPQQLLPYGDAMAYASALRVLQQQEEYSPAALERTVEAIRADVASRLWQLVVVESGLMDYLGALKDYMLLAKGDFYQGFLTDAARTLALPPNKVADKDLAVIWQAAASKSTAADDPHFKHFKLVINEQLAQVPDTAAEAKQHVPPPPLLAADCLQLEAHLPWPLGVLVTPKHLASYNELFRLLLKVKRVQLDLEAAWQELGRLCGRKGGSTRPQDIGELLRLRQHMGHLITNLQVYLQLDVIEANFDWLEHQVAAAQDFAEVAQAHEKFVKALKQQSLLYSNKLMSEMARVFVLARQLCGLVKGARERGIDFDAVQEVKRAFGPAVKDMCMSIRSKFLQQHDRAPYLNQLHERLDYNNYLSGYVKIVEPLFPGGLKDKQHRAAV